MAQKQMDQFGFGQKFNDPKYFELGFFWIFLGFGITLRASDFWK